MPSTSPHRVDLADESEVEGGLCRYSPAITLRADRACAACRHRFAPRERHVLDLTNRQRYCIGHVPQETAA